MEVIYSHCAALDVPKNSLIANVITLEHREIRTYVTMTKDLLELKRCLLDPEVTH